MADESTFFLECLRYKAAWRAPDNVNEDNGCLNKESQATKQRLAFGGQMIKKVQGGYQVLSEKGKNLGGPYKTREQAEKRLREVEFFKRRKP